MGEDAHVEMSRPNNRGFTLIELLAAMVITMVGLLGLLQAINVAMEHNLKNQLRDEAVLIAEQWMGNLKTRGFSQLSGVSDPSQQFSPKTVSSQLRARNVAYTVNRQCASLNAPASTAARLTVTVTWNVKGTSYTHTVISLRSQ